MSISATAEPATVDGSVGEQEPEISSIHPLALDAIWSSISVHLTSNEWLRVVTACKASWNVHLPQIVVTEETSIAGVHRNCCGGAVQCWQMPRSYWQRSGLVAHACCQTQYHA